MASRIDLHVAGSITIDAKTSLLRKNMISDLAAKLMPATPVLATAA